MQYNNILKGTQTCFYPLTWIKIVSEWPVCSEVLCFNSDEPGSFLWYHKYTRLNYPNEENKDLLKEMYCMALGSLKMNDDQTVLRFFPNVTLGHRNYKNWSQTEVLYIQSTSRNSFLTCYHINLLLSILLSHIKNKSTFFFFLFLGGWWGAAEPKHQHFTWQIFPYFHLATGAHIHIQEC